MQKSLLDKLEHMAGRFDEINAMLSDPAVIGDQQKYRSLSKEQRDLTPIVEAYTRYRKVRADAESLRQIVNSTGEPELRQMAEAELPDAEARLITKAVDPHARVRTEAVRGLSFYGTMPAMRAVVAAAEEERFEKTLAAGQYLLRATAAAGARAAPSRSPSPLRAT